MLFKFSCHRRVVSLFCFMGIFWIGSICCLMGAQKEGVNSAIVSASEEIPVVSMGNPEAPLKITVFHSLNCPHCIDFKNKSLPEIQKEFIKTGHVYLIFVDFPTNRDSLGAAKVAWASRDIEQYRIISEILSQNFEKWSGHENWEDMICKILAENQLMTEEECRQALADEALGKAILKPAFEGQKNYKIDFAPAFLINGKLHTSPNPFSVTDVKNELEKMQLDIKD